MVQVGLENRIPLESGVQYFGEIFGQGTSGLGCVGFEDCRIKGL